MYLNLFFLVSSCFNFVKPDQNSVLKQLAGEYSSEDNIDMIKCAKAIAERNFHYRQNVEILSAKASLINFEDFGIVARNTPAEFRYPDLRKGHVTKYAIIFLEIINRQLDLKPLNVLARYHPQGRFIVVVNRRGENPANLDEEEEYLDQIIEYLANMKRWKVVILAKTGVKIRVYTYTMHPSISMGCRRVPKLLDRLIYCDNESDLNPDKLFPAFFSLNKCPIILATVHFPPLVVIYEENGKKRIHSIEGNALKLIVEKFNATYEITSQYNGTILREMVRNGEADISFGYLYQAEDPGNTWTRSFVFVHTLIVIPQSLLMPMWMNLILPYQTGVWVTLGTMIALQTSIKLLIPPVRKKFHLEWMLLGFFGIGIAKLPRRLSQRLYIVSWILVGYVVMQSYSASLMGFFTSPGQYKPIQDLEELEKSKIVISGIQNMKKEFSNAYPRIGHDFKVFTHGEYLSNMAKLKARQGGIATYAPEIQVMDIIRGQESNFIVIPKDITIYPLAVLLKNSSAILNGSNRVLGRVIEAGLVQFWERSLNREIVQYGESKIDQRLLLDKLSAVFYLLLIVHCLSVVVFFLELVTSKLSVERNTSNGD